MNQTSYAISLLVCLFIGGAIGFFVGQNTTCVKLPFGTSTACVTNLK